MSGQNEYLGYLHMGGGIGGIDGHIGNIVAREGLDALIELGGAGRIAMEADVAEIGLDEAGLEVGDADGRVGHIDAEAVAKGLYGCLRGAVDIATGIGCIARHTPYINNVSAVALNHTGYDEARHREQALDIGVDHGLPVIEVALVFGFEAEGQAGIIDEYVDLLPLLGQAFDGLAGGLAVADVEGEDEHLGALGLQLLADGFQLLYVTASQDESVAIGGELARAAEANAARGACNQYGLVHILMWFVNVFFIFMGAKLRFFLEE